MVTGCYHVSLRILWLILTVIALSWLLLLARLLWFKVNRLVIICACLGQFRQFCLGKLFSNLSIYLFSIICISSEKRQKPFILLSECLLDLLGVQNGARLIYLVPDSIHANHTNCLLHLPTLLILNLFFTLRAIVIIRIRVDSPGGRNEPTTTPPFLSPQYHNLQHHQINHGNSTRIVMSDLKEIGWTHLDVQWEERLTHEHTGAKFDAGTASRPVPIVFVDLRNPQWTITQEQHGRIIQEIILEHG